MDDKKGMQQNIQLEERERLFVSGVLGVEEFCEEKIVLETVLGFLEVTGTELRMNKLSVDDGELAIEGDITGLLYSEETSAEKGGLFSRLFR
ncbi:MAG: sporulation protein YabP [Clostridia bacterium]|nr:sporulation protein YabP [Clostridia bacterium]